MAGKKAGKKGQHMMPSKHMMKDSEMGKKMPPKGMPMKKGK